MLSHFDGPTRKILWDKVYDYDFYTDMYLRRNQEIKRYFAKSPKKLLVIDVAREKKTQRICEFLVIPLDLVVDMPHLNET